MENQLIKTADLAVIQQAKTGKYPLAPYLPKDLLAKLPEITRAEISQSTLKHASDEEISVFSARVLSFINPKFNDQQEIEIAEAELYSFAKRCELTTSEYLLALELAADGRLYSEPDESGKMKRIQLFREIDRLKLGEVKSAYNHLKTIEKQHEMGKAEIKAFLQPPQPELTPEEKAAQRHQMALKTFKEEYRRLKEYGEIWDCFTFYDIITAKMEKGLVKLKFVEATLSTFQMPKGHIRSKDPEVIKIQFDTNPLNHFKKHFVLAFFLKEKLDQLNETEWLGYWEEQYMSI